MAQNRRAEASRLRSAAMLIAALAVMALIVAVGILVTWLFMRGEKNPASPTSSPPTED